MTATTARLIVQLFMASALILAATGAHAVTQARIAETSPADAASLGSQQQFWVRIEYQTDEPVRLWARPYREGVQIKQTMTKCIVGLHSLRAGTGLVRAPGVGRHRRSAHRGWRRAPVSRVGGGTSARRSALDRSASGRRG